MAKKNRLSAILGGIILILAAFIVFQNFSGFDGLASLSSTISEDELEEKVIEVIGQDVGNPDEVSVENIEKEGPLYKINIKVMGQDYESYATLDGEYLFPQKINLNPPKPKEITKTKKPDVKLFVMSYCPFGNQAEELLAPVNELLKNKANIELHYIIYSNYLSGYPEYCLDEENKYCSMHGIQEINQGIRELCVQKYQKDKLWDFVKEMNVKASSENADEKWEKIAKNLEIDIDEIKTCQEKEGLNLLDQELELTQKKYSVQNPAKHNGQEKQSVSGSPTLVINDIIYDGDRSSNAYQETICSAFLSEPKECAEELKENQTAPNGSCE
jgi:hypothetical protein